MYKESHLFSHTPEIHVYFFHPSEKQSLLIFLFCPFKAGDSDSSASMKTGDGFKLHAFKKIQCPLFARNFCHANKASDLKR